MLEEKRPLKVFLCHAHSDRDKVRALYSRLKREGVDAWLDKEKLFPGSDWEYEIRKAVREADVVVVCLSKQFNQAGFRQKEVRIALDTAMEQPEGEIFIIPARLEECENLESLRKWHWVDLFEDDGFQRLIRALRARADRIGATLRIRRGGQSITSPPRSKEPEKTVEPFAINTDIGSVDVTEIQETQSIEEAEREAVERAERERVTKEEREKEEREAAEKTIDDSRQQTAVKIQPEILKRLPYKENKDDKDIPQAQKLKNENPKSSNTKTRSKTNTAITIALIGFAGTIIAALLGSPIIEKWLFPTLVPGATESTQSQMNQALELSVKAKPSQYLYPGEKIIYVYTITNIGSATLGPTQFVVKDDLFPSPFNCGSKTTVLETNDSVICEEDYEISAADTGVTYIRNSVSASGGGVTSVTADSIAVKIDLAIVGTPSISFIPGSTIEHKVVPGEWLAQVARCYGADLGAILDANPQINDVISNVSVPIVTVPNIGRNGSIYGPPCIAYHTVRSGDTWLSIANRYSADISVLQSVNSGITLSVDSVIKVPVSSILPTPRGP